MSRRPVVVFLACMIKAWIQVVFVCALAASLWAPSSGHGAEPPAPNDNDANLKTITVEAARERAALEHRVDAFVSAIAIRPWRESLPRWDTPICPLVAGMQRAQGEFILQRLSQIAAAAGAPLANEHCRANFYVIATRDPDALLKAWRKRDARMFGSAPEPKIQRFLNSSRPVRVWYNADTDAAGGMPMTADGGGAMGFGAATANSGANNQPFTGIPTNAHAKLSRLEYDEIQNVSSAIVIVDTGRAKGINFGQLADYISLTGLTEIDLDADLGNAPTILRLFAASADAQPPGLTAWDQAFLSAMYHTAQKDKMQLSVIETRVVKDLVR